MEGIYHINLFVASHYLVLCSPAQSFKNGFANSVSVDDDRDRSSITRSMNATGEIRIEE